MKQLVDATESVVDDFLESFASVNAHVGLIREARVLYDQRRPQKHRVALISGGGSGHEPAHGGYIGDGMLSAVVCGGVFASPSTSAVLTAIRKVTGDAGCLLIVKNYTGDRLNFGLAMEMARAEGYCVDMVVVDDDCALRAAAGAEEREHAGARGIAGTVLVHKLAGAAAAAGTPLAQVAAEARRVIDEVATMGCAFSPCTLPGAAKPSFELGNGEAEFGLGIHGEPGVSREAMPTSEALANRLVERVSSFANLVRGDSAALMVNNLGCMTPIEMHVFAGNTLRKLASVGIHVTRVYVGSFMTALDMRGVSISLIRVDSDRVARLDDFTDAPAWPNQNAIRSAPAVPQRGGEVASSAVTASSTADAPTEAEDGRIAALFRAVHRALAADAERLSELDRQCGDGDIGASLLEGCRRIDAAAARGELRDEHTAEALASIGRAVGDMGGSSGPLYGIFFLRAAAAVRESGAEGVRGWSFALRAGATALAETGNARAGDCTMLDALLPAVTALESSDEANAVHAAAKAAAEGAEQTKAMVPKRGRASYLGERARGCADPGAAAVAAIFAALSAAW